jgi:hypothetical protein
MQAGTQPFLICAVALGPRLRGCKGLSPDNRIIRLAALGR